MSFFGFLEAGIIRAQGVLVLRNDEPRFAKYSEYECAGRRYRVFDCDSDEKRIMAMHELA